jgi:hypothetical protein
MSGYVRIHRSLIGHPAFRNDAEAMAFAWLVAKAAWKPIRVRYKERGIYLSRGQVAISQRDMAKALDRDKAWVERLWKRLRAEAMVTVASEAGVAVITICNYDEYQAERDTREAADEAPDKADARQTQGTEQRREEREEDNITPIVPRKRGSRTKSVKLPDWLPLEAWGDFTESRRKMRNVPFEAGAQRRVIAKLERLRGEGHCPEKLLNKAVERGYRTVFEGDDTKAPPRQLTHQEQIENLESALPMYERWGRQDMADDCKLKIERLRRTAPIGKIANGILKQAGAAQ